MAISRKAILTMKRSYSCSMPGVWRAVAHSEGALVIFHSPKACGHVAHDMDLGSHYRSLARQEWTPRQYTAPLIASGLTEEHSIFGGTEQLCQCIDYAVENYKPQYIMIANSCVAGVIGDDVKAAALSGEEKWQIPILTVETHGFLGSDYYTGLYQGASALIERFMVPQEVKENTVTLLGDRGGLQGADVVEIKDMLKAFGLSVHCQFPGYSSLAEIRRVPSSSLCVLMGGRQKSHIGIHTLAGDLNIKFKIPFFDEPCPIGWQETIKWLKKLGRFLGKEEEASAVIRAQEEKMQQALQRYSSKLEGQKTVLCIGRPLLYFDPAWVLELLIQARVNVTGIILLQGLTGEQQQNMQAELEKYTTIPILLEEEGTKVLETADLAVTTHELSAHIRKQFFLPVVPPAGTGGLIELLAKLARLAVRTKQRGGIIYG